MSRVVSISCVCAATMLAAMPAEAGVAGKAIREAGEFVGRKFGREVAEEGSERLTATMLRLASKHGDDVVVAAFKKVGPRAGKIAGEAGENADTVLRLLAKHGDDAVPLVAKAASLKAVSRFGDDAATALIRHGAVGEELVERLGQEGAEALARVTPQNGRRLAMLAADGQLKPELVSVVARYGDEACDFIWRNKGSLVVGAALTTFVASPEEFLNGTQKLAATVGEAAVKPLAEVPKTIAAHTNWTLLMMLTAMLVGVLTIPRKWKARCAFWLIMRCLPFGKGERKRP